MKQNKVFSDFKKEESKEQWKREQAQEFQEYLTCRKKILSLSPEERGVITPFTELVWWAFTGKKEIPADVQMHIKKRQTMFFVFQPDRMYASPTCYREFLPESPISKSAYFFIERTLRYDASFF